MSTDERKKDFAQRLKYKMKLQGMTIGDLSEKTGISYEMIRRYSAGISKPRESNVVLLAEALSTTASYLDYGTDPDGTAANVDAVVYSDTIDHSDMMGATDYIKPLAGAAVESLRYIPILNFSQAKSLHETGSIAIADYFKPVMGAFYSERVYGLIIEDNSMSPEFNRRDLVLINPDLEPAPSDFVLACIDNSPNLIFRRYRPRGFDEATGETYEQLVPEHTDFPIIDNRHTNFEVCGVAIERTYRLK